MDEVDRDRASVRRSRYSDLGRPLPYVRAVTIKRRG
jgi:hypothetical protein